jgi:hypothetical protein
MKRGKTCFTQKYQENKFSVQPGFFFSYIKVTQIQPSGDDEKQFTLTFFELSVFIQHK